jgi:hypothetical protein
MRIFLFSPTSRPALRPSSPASHPMGIGSSFPGGKAAGGEADDLPPSSAEDKNAWSCTSPHPIRLRDVVLN